MRCAVLTDGYAGVGRAYLNIKMRIADGIAYLLKCSAGGKHCKRAAERDLARRCNACRDSDHVALCDTAVEEALRECLLEFYRLGRLCKVCVENDHVCRI